MTKHRSLNDALNLSPEKLAFIKGQDPSAAEMSQTQSTTKSKPASSTNSRDAQVQTPKSKPNRPKVTSRNKEQARDSTKDKLGQQEPPVAHSDNYRVPITTRLQPRTANALRRAYLQRKIQRLPMATQQEIIEAALQDWLRKNSYLTD